MCSIGPVTPEANCTDGAIRLQSETNLANPLEGRVEICFNRAWGTVCDNGFGQPEANAICNQLDHQFGFAHSSAIPKLNASFGEGQGPIFIDNIGCRDDDVFFRNCSVFGIIGYHECYHSKDAGVICKGG